MVCRAKDLIFTLCLNVKGLPLVQFQCLKKCTFDTFRWDTIGKLFSWHNILICDTNQLLCINTKSTRWRNVALILFWKCTSLTDVHNSTVTSCIFSPGDDRIVTTSMDRTTKFYDRTSCKTTVTLKYVKHGLQKYLCRHDKKYIDVTWHTSHLFIAEGIQTLYPMPHLVKTNGLWLQCHGIKISHCGTYRLECTGTDIFSITKFFIRRRTCHRQIAHIFVSFLI